MISTRLRRVLIILLSLLAAAGCDSPVDCDSRCQDRYEECLAEGEGTVGCDVALDDCLDRCYATGRAGPDGG